MRTLPDKLFRFATVGVANAVIYAVSTAFFVRAVGLDGKIASVLGYMTALPLAFFAHRSYTFSSQGAVKLEIPRFVVTHLTSLFVSVFAMAAAVDFLGLPYWVGIIGGIVLVPIATFVALDAWVFSQPKRPSGG